MGDFLYNDIFPSLFLCRCLSETHTSGREDIGMGYTKSFGVLSRNARQKAGSTASIRCQRSRQRGPEKVRLSPDQ
jgi:hypothetical protein